MANPSKHKNRVKTDLADSADDKKHMQPDKGTLDLPDVKDIPGQEHVRPLPPGEMADTTISSADEEGKGILDDEPGVVEQFNSNVTKDERELLEDSENSMGTTDDLSLKKALVDSTDDDGEPLNENADQSGDDLDVPGSEDDDANEITGEEDEENNSYSLNDDKEDDINTRQ